MEGLTPEEKSVFDFIKNSEEHLYPVQVADHVGMNPGETQIIMNSLITRKYLTPEEVYGW